MIQYWHLKNFKSVGQDMYSSPDERNFRKLTLFAGTNSSGKSTVLQSILLLMQTLASQEEKVLDLNGSLLSLGTVHDVWHHGRLPANYEDTNRCLKFDVILEDIYDDSKAVGFSFELAAIDADSEKLHLVQSRYSYGTGTDTSQHERSLEIKWHSDTGRYQMTAISDTLYEEILEEMYEKQYKQIENFLNADVHLTYFYPDEFHVNASVIDRGLTWDSALTDPRNFPEEVNGVISALQEIPPEYWQVLREAAREQNLHGLEKSSLPFGFGSTERLVHTFGDYKVWVANLTTHQSDQLYESLEQRFRGHVDADLWYTPAIFDKIHRTVQEFFTQRVRYLSAYRIPPTMLFTPDVTSRWSEVGISGSNVAPAIRDYAERVIRFYDPVDQEIKETSFLNALVTWLQIFGIIDNIEIEDRGKLGTVLHVRDANMDGELDLTAVGFGTSQLLPVLVQGLLTPPGGIFMVEQPEVHLHPAVQSKLADFFLSLTYSNVQCIIETHSEHIVNRLRLRIVEDSTADVLDRIQMFFAIREGGVSRFTPVTLNNNGAITQWPPGFFDQAENENILIAKTSSKKRRASIRERGEQ